MPFPTVTYKLYEEWGGTLDEGAFMASSKAAVSAVRDVIGYNEPQDEEDEDAYIRAVCAAVDVDNFYGASGGLGESSASISLGKFSASAGDAQNGASSYQTDMARNIRRELVGSGLMYQGLS